MGQKIVVVDYGSGNLRSVQRGLERAGFASVVASDRQTVVDASHLIVPGVGAFQSCMKRLDALNLITPIIDAIRGGKPYLGICLGYQILFTEGEEFGGHPGLGIVPGRVVHFPEGHAETPSGEKIKVPHMGWNRVHVKPAALTHAAWEAIPDGAYFYFVHSYYPEPADPAWVATTTEHGVTFASAIARDNLFACQFHPEKSQAVGIRLLQNFARMK